MKSRLRWTLDRWRLYRRWGRRSTWTGNNAHDITLKERDDWSFFVEGWSLCRCGKEHYVWTTAPDRDLAERMIQLAGEMCFACKAFVYRRHDQCPEGNCTLGFEHKGRCQPFVITDEIREELLRASEAIR